MQIDPANWPVFGIVAAVLAATVTTWLFVASRPLTLEEVEHLAVERRLRSLGQEFDFSGWAPPVSFDLRMVKGAMRANGQFLSFSEPVHTFPAVAGALLKGKKHEWLLFGFARGSHVVGVWFNKGEDGTQVRSGLSTTDILRVGARIGATSILEFHNHPNPDPRRYSTATASAQDKNAADVVGAACVARGCSFHAFVIERGRHYQYAIWVPDALSPIATLRDQIIIKNGLSRRTNFSLRHELGRQGHIGWLLRTPKCSTNLRYSRAPAGASTAS